MAKKKPQGSGVQSAAIEQISTAELIPYARNARTHSEQQVRQIAGSIQEFGFCNPVLIAAEQLNRKCYGMEISPAYCDVIVKRWENLTGKKAVLEAA